MKNKKPRGKWDRKIKYPTNLSQQKKLTFWDSLKIFLKNPVQVISMGVQYIANPDKSLITDKWYKERLNFDLGTYLDWYFTSKGFLHSIDWMGIPTRKLPMDLWIYQELIVETRPDFIIEIGALYGGSTQYLATICEELEHGTVISVDINRDLYQATHNRIINITGDSTSHDVFSHVQEIVGNGTAMLIHDGDHQSNAVLTDLGMYASLVSKGMYLVIEDGVVDLFDFTRSKFPNGGPLVAARKFLKMNQDTFEIDSRRERFILTSNPEGYLRRK